MLAASRILVLICGAVLIGGLVLAGPDLIDSAGMLKRHLLRRSDGVGLAPSFMPCDPAAPGFVGADPESCSTPGAANAALGAHVLLWHEDGAGPPIATTPAITTQVSGSSLIAFSAGYASNTLGPTDNKDNLWQPLGAPVVYRGYNGVFNVKAYLANAARGGAGHTLSIVKNGAPSGEITVPFIEVRQSTALHAVAQNYPLAASVVTSGSVTTSGPATLVAVWWGDAGGLVHSAVPDNGFSIIENFVNLPPNSAVQCVVATRQVSAAGSWQVSWTQSPTQGAVLWLFAFQFVDEVFASGFE
jgi:hypothetical protein